MPVAPAPRRRPPTPPRRIRWRRLAILAAAPVVLFALLLFVAQDAMIFHPRPAEPVPEGIVTLRWDAPAGGRVAYWRPPTDGGAPRRVWVWFNGNAGLACDWVPLLDRLAPARDDGHLLIEYPGYGACAGSPSLDGIDDCAHQAFAALAARLGESPATLAPRCGVVGLSLGCAGALRFAAALPVRAVVVIAPFTSLRAMAWRQVGPFCLLLRANADNAARIAELAAHAPRPALTIVHGTDDRTISCAMGRVLADAHPDWIRFTAVPGAGHEDIVDLGAEAIAQAIAHDAR